MANPNDAVRDALLRYLNTVHKSAKGMKKVGIGIRDLQRAMKAKHGYKQAEVVSNLDYLVQKSWIAKVTETRTFRTAKGAVQPEPKVTYKISASGIDRLEAASTYQRPPTARHLNITNIRGVTVVGEGNVVNTTFTDVARILSEMRQAVLSATTISDADKLEVAAGVDTLQAQLQKPTPDKGIVKMVWSGIEKIVTAGGFAELAARTAELLGPLVS